MFDIKDVITQKGKVSEILLTNLPQELKDFVIGQMKTTVRF